VVWVIGIDIGGGGARLRACSLTSSDVIEVASSTPLQVNSAGSTAADLIGEVARRFDQARGCECGTSAVERGSSLDAGRAGGLGGSGQRWSGALSASTPLSAAGQSTAQIAAVAVGASGVMSLVPAVGSSVVGGYDPRVEPGAPQFEGDAVVRPPGDATTNRDSRQAAPERDPRHDTIHAALATHFCVPVTAVASDAVTAHLGALGGRAGGVVAVGTGLVGLGTDFDTIWHRVDGWGHILGDLGSGAWIGRQGLQAALAAVDGRPGASALVLEAATRLYGPPTGWPAMMQTRPDRASLLAKVAPLVGAAAKSGDGPARRILRQAIRHIAEAVCATVSPSVMGGSERDSEAVTLPAVASVTGGVLNLDERLWEKMTAQVREIRPDVTVVPAVGSPLDGAIFLARALAEGRWSAQHAPWITWRRHDPTGSVDEVASTSRCPKPAQPIGSRPASTSDCHATGGPA
jgi:N-acetylglucosamine kinase-like BadF-type ATPase